MRKLTILITGQKYIDGKYYFIKYKKDCPYSDPNLLGAEIIEIDGLPTQQYVEKNVLPYITGSTQRFKLNRAGRILLNGLQGSSIQGKAQCMDGCIKTFNIIRNGEAIRREDDVWLPKEECSYYSSKAVTLNWKNDIAILNIRRFIPESVCNDIDKAMTEIHAHRCKGVIIDLRGNGGGITDVALEVTNVSDTRGHHSLFWCTNTNQLRLWACTRQLQKRI